MSTLDDLCWTAEHIKQHGGEQVMHVFVPVRPTKYDSKMPPWLTQCCYPGTCARCGKHASVTLDWQGLDFSRPFEALMRAETHCEGCMLDRAVELGLMRITGSCQATEGMKPREREFMLSVYEADQTGRAKWVRDRIVHDPLPDKLKLYYLRKWYKRGWWEFGVSEQSGWFTRAADDVIHHIEMEAKHGGELCPLYWYYAPATPVATSTTL